MIYLVNDTLKRKNFNHATIEDVVDYCKDKTILSVDTETTGLDYIKQEIKKHNFLQTQEKNLLKVTIV